MKVMEPVLRSDLRVREFPEICLDSLQYFYGIFNYKILKGILDIVSFPFLPTSSLGKESRLKLKRSKGVAYERNLHTTATSFTVFINQHLFWQTG